jgi:hypothetical protein
MALLPLYRALPAACAGHVYQLQRRALFSAAVPKNSFNPCTIYHSAAAEAFDAANVAASAGSGIGAMRNSSQSRTSYLVTQLRIQPTAATDAPLYKPTTPRTHLSLTLIIRTRARPNTHLLVELVSHFGWAFGGHKHDGRCFFARRARFTDHPTTIQVARLAPSDKRSETGMGTHSAGVRALALRRH